MRRQTKASSAGSTDGNGASGRLRLTGARYIVASSDSDGSGARAGRLLSTVPLLLIACLAFATTASAKTTNQYLSQVSRSTAPTGSSAPLGLTTASTGDLYVAVAAGEGTIEHYGPSGAFVGEFHGADTPSGKLAINPNSIAAAPGGGLYATDAETGVVDRFDAAGAYVSAFDGSGTPQGSFVPIQIAVAPGGDVYVVDGATSLVDRFGPTGAYLGQFDGSGTPQGSFCPTALAVAPDEHVYVADECSASVDQFNAAGSYLSQFEGAGTPQSFFSPAGLAIDAAEDVYVRDQANGVVDEFDLAGTFLSQIDGSTTPQGSFAASAITAGPADSVYLADPGHPVIDRFSGTQVVVPEVGTEAAGAVGNTTATLNGTVTPDGVALTECRFEFVPASQFETDGYEGVTAGEQVPCVPAAGSIAADANPHPVTAELTGLTPNTTYHFRLVAANTAGATRGLDESFITLAPPSLSGEAASGNTSDEVTLDATIDPNGSETFYRFEYGLSSSYGTVLPEPEGVLPAERADQTVSVHIVGLMPETTYHYKVIAHSSAGTTESVDLTFRTAGGLFPLPDNRAWEQVSPVDKHGVNITSIQWVSEDGDSVGFEVLAAIAGGETLRSFNSYLARRTDAGWITQPLTLPSRLAPANGSPSSAPQFLSSSLDKALLIGQVPAAGASPISAGPGSGVERLFMETLPADPSAPPTYAVAGPDLVSLEGPQDFISWGAAPELSSIVFADTAQLTADPIGDLNHPGLYEIAETGRGGAAPLRRVDVDNAGNPISLGVDRIADGFNDVSKDGSRVFFDDENGQVYARTDASTTTSISEPSPSECQPSCVEPAVQSAHFAGASESGTRAYFVTSQELVPADTDTTPDLYEYDFSAASGHHLILISEGGEGDATPGAGAEVEGMVRLSDDGSRAAFVARGVLTTTPNSSGDHAVGGAENLYVRSDAGGAATTKFVGVLLPSDSLLWEADDVERPAQMSSTDGRYLVFDTHANLTSDDTDAATDVYRYDDQTGNLLLVSHAADGSEGDGNGTKDAGIAAPRFVIGGENGPQSQAGRVRAISDDGSTIVFHTAESLQQVDQNGTPDIYEWQKGKVTLIGDPQDPSRSGGTGVLSRSGEDLFTLTGSALVPQDTDGTVRDVYDARVGGGIPFTPPSACDALTEGCQPPSSLPPAPASSATSKANPNGNGSTRISLGKVSSSDLTKFSRTGKLTIAVTGPAGDTVKAKATGEIKGKKVTVGSATHRLGTSGEATIQIPLSKGARRQLSADGKLVVKLTVADPQAGSSSAMNLKLTSRQASSKKKGGGS